MEFFRHNKKPVDNIFGSWFSVKSLVGSIRLSIRRQISRQPGVLPPRALLPDITWGGAQKISEVISLDRASCFYRVQTVKKAARLLASSC